MIAAQQRTGNTLEQIQADKFHLIIVQSDGQAARRTEQFRMLGKYLLQRQGIGHHRDGDSRSFGLPVAGFDKAAAMQFVLEYFGIPWEESYAFGDSANDLAMIRYACHSVVMGEHSSVLEPHASFVTKRVEEDGIAYAMECLNII